MPDLTTVSKISKINSCSRIAESRRAVLTFHSTNSVQKLLPCCIFICLCLHPICFSTNMISYLKHICLPFVGDKDGNIFVSDLSHLPGRQIWLHICPTFVSFPNVVKLIISSSDVPTLINNNFGNNNRDSIKETGSSCSYLLNFPRLMFKFRALRG